MLTHRIVAVAVCLTLCGLVLGADQAPSRPAGAPAQPPQRTPADDGFTDTPMLPQQPWHVHDSKRPHPPVVTPGATAGAAPSDARVLFDGRDLSAWAHHDRTDSRKLLEPKWAVRNGTFETGAGTGDLFTRESFGDVQLHVEWAPPTVVDGHAQARGNSGIFLMGLYEIQVLDSYNNPTYADGQAGAMYGQWPPLANAARKSGEWQTYDIVFEAPRFEGGTLVKPAFQTVFWNGVLIHNRKEVMGATVWRNVAKYTPHASELPLMLQDHGNPVRYRNIWVRRLGSYDQASAQKPGAPPLLQDYTAFAVTPPPPALGLDPFYKKFVDAHGIPVVTSDKAPDAALLMARDIVQFMLANRPDLRKELIRKKWKVAIMAQSEVTYDIPEHRKFRLLPKIDDERLTPEQRENYHKPGGVGTMTGEQYWNGRGRGFGGEPDGENTTSCAEENLLGYPGTRYFGSSICVHEFSHGIMRGAVYTVDPEYRTAVEEAYAAAKSQGLSSAQGYPGNNFNEYWATGIEAYVFGSGQGPESLLKADPRLYELVRQVIPSTRMPGNVYVGRVRQPPAKK